LNVLRDNECHRANEKEKEMIINFSFILCLLLDVVEEREFLLCLRLKYKNAKVCT